MSNAKEHFQTVVLWLAIAVSSKIRPVLLITSAELTAVRPFEALAIDHTRARCPDAIERECRSMLRTVGDFLLIAVSFRPQLLSQGHADKTH